MADFSRLPQDELADAIEKGYVGIYFQQGVPILDRDLNLLQDLVATTVRSILGRYIGNGLPLGGEGFQIRAIPADNDFRISAGSSPPGSCLVAGIEVKIGADHKYTDQSGLPALTTPAGAGLRHDIVYLDVSLETVGAAAADDDSLLNAGDVGVETSVRVRPTWIVRVAEGAEQPPPAPTGHTHYALARLERPATVAQVRDDMIVDLRQTGMNLDDVERRLSSVELLRITPALAPPSHQLDPIDGKAKDQVTIFGRNLDLDPKVKFGTVDAPELVKVERNQLQVKVPTMPTGTVHITVTTGAGTLQTTDTFTVRP